MPEFEDSTLPQRRSGFTALLGFVLGNAMQMQQAALWDMSGYAVLLLISALALLLGSSVASRGAARSLGVTIAQGVLVFVALTMFGFAITGLRAHYFAGGNLNPMLEGLDVRVTGVVTDLPQRNESGLRFRMEVESAMLDGASAAVPRHMQVGWYGGVYSTGSELLDLQRQPQDLKAGERWSMTLRLKAPHGSRNPFGFDYELWLWEQGVQATAYVRAGINDAAPQRLAQTWQHPIALARQIVRDRIYSRVPERRLAGLVAALVVGDENAIDSVDWDVFRATGVAHLVIISGLHITMFAWGARWLIARLWRRSARLCLEVPAPTAALVGGVWMALAYSLFSGWGIPAQRTCLMLATVAGLRLLGARWPWPHVWMLACAVVVACDPWALMQAGFWLSFVAVGILFATDAPEHPPPQSTPARHGTTLATRIIGKMRAGLRTQWVITVALSPLTLLLFGQMSLVGLVANAFAVPWVTLVVTPIALLGVLVPWLWQVAGLTCAWLMALLQYLAALPWATLALPAAPLWAGALGVVGGVIVAGRLPWHLRVMGLPLICPVLLWQPALPLAGQFELLAADIGQGNAVLVRTAHHALLYDAGPRYSLESDAGHRVLLPLLEALQTRLDRVVLSHRDIDHTGGAAAVLTMQPQAGLLSSLEDDHPLQAIRRAQRCESGQGWEWDGVRFDILHPQADDYLVKATPNAMSCVLRISNGVRTALLVGDLERRQEERLVAQGAPLRSDVLLVPHHGSKTSSSDDFLDAVQPTWALVQSGYRNRYGHPAQPVMQRYRDRHITVRDSPHCGAATWNSNHVDALQCTRTEQSHYWSHNVP